VSLSRYEDVKDCNDYEKTLLTAEEGKLYLLKNRQERPLHLDSFTALGLASCRVIAWLAEGQRHRQILDRAVLWLRLHQCLSISTALKVMEYVHEQLDPISFTNTPMR